MRKFSTSFLRAALVCCLLSAASGAARGYWQPPPPCTATAGGNTWGYTAVYDSVAMKWAYYFWWTNNFSCSTGMLSLCQMCYETSFQYWSPEANNWIEIADWYVPSHQYSCGTLNDVSNLGITCPPSGYLTSGVTYQLLAYACPWNPAFPGCNPNVQNYGKYVWYKEWTCPPPKPE